MEEQSRSHQQIGEPYTLAGCADRTLSEKGTDRGGKSCCRTEERIMAHFGQPGSRQSIEYKDAAPDVFNKWFPGLKLSSTACTNARQGSFCIYH